MGQSGSSRSLRRKFYRNCRLFSYWKKMKICLVLLALLVAVACGHKNDGGSYSAKKADKLSFKESLIEKIHSFKDKIQAKISSKKAKVHAKKALKHGNWGAHPAADCSTVLDEVWEEQCGTKYEPVCRMEMQPHCTLIQAKECAPESQTRCSFVFEDKCKTISVPKCTIDWEKRCTSTPDCTTIEAKSCTEVEKDVCITHMDKTCTMSTLNVCRKVAVRELIPVVDTVERTGLKASIKAKAAAHKAHKAGLKASIKAKVAAHKAQKKGQLPGYAARSAEDAGLEEKGSLFDFLGVAPISPGDIAISDIDEDNSFSIDADEGQRRRRGANHAYGRTSQSLKGDTSGDQTAYLAAKSADFKGRLETFKAGFKAAKDQYHEAKAQFKATTKALIHAKFNKGPKASKGDKGLKGYHVKAAVPTIRVRYEKSCQDEPRKTCTQTPRQECHKEVVPLCKSEPRETCVPKEKCKSWPKKNCGMVHKETCLPFPAKKCTEISKPVCRIVPRQECTEKKHEICETVPIKDCQKVLVSKPRTVCIPRPTTRTIEDW